jgi:hypothetical protein
MALTVMVIKMTKKKIIFPFSVENMDLTYLNYPAGWCVSPLLLHAEPKPGRPVFDATKAFLKHARSIPA